jgi:5'-nucleotidase
LLHEFDGKLGPDGKPVLVDKEEVLRASTRKYLIMCGEYMWQGGDGYDALKGKKAVITSENGQSMCALVRKFLLGAF